jgi:hypothetical protein
VTARWRPVDARRDVIEEAPVFHPTEEVSYSCSMSFLLSFLCSQYLSLNVKCFFV